MNRVTYCYEASLRRWYDALFNGTDQSKSPRYSMPRLQRNHTHKNDRSIPFFKPGVLPVLLQRSGSWSRWWFLQYFLNLCRSYLPIKYTLFLRLCKKLKTVGIPTVFDIWSERQDLNLRPLHPQRRSPSKSLQVLQMLYDLYTFLHMTPTLGTY